MNLTDDGMVGQVLQVKPRDWPIWRKKLQGNAFLEKRNKLWEKMVAIRAFKA
jgi:hypothetical protein